MLKNSFSKLSFFLPFCKRRRRASRAWLEAGIWKKGAISKSRTDYHRLLSLGYRSVNEKRAPTIICKGPSRRGWLDFSPRRRKSVVSLPASSFMIRAKTPYYHLANHPDNGSVFSLACIGLPTSSSTLDDAATATVVQEVRKSSR